MGIAIIVYVEERLYYELFFILKKVQVLILLGTFVMI